MSFKFSRTSEQNIIYEFLFFGASRYGLLELDLLVLFYTFFFSLLAEEVADSLLLISIFALSLDESFDLILLRLLSLG
jgi:hypothetical protein